MKKSRPQIKNDILKTTLIGAVVILSAGSCTRPFNEKQSFFDRYSQTHAYEQLIGNKIIPVVETVAAGNVSAIFREKYLQDLEQFKDELVEKRSALVSQAAYIRKQIKEPEEKQPSQPSQPPGNSESEPAIMPAFTYKALMGLALESRARKKSYLDSLSNKEVIIPATILQIENDYYSARIKARVPLHHDHMQAVAIPLVVLDVVVRDDRIYKELKRYNDIEAMIFVREATIQEAGPFTLVNIKGDLNQSKTRARLNIKSWAARDSWLPVSDKLHSYKPENNQGNTAAKTKEPVNKNTEQKEKAATAEELPDERRVDTWADDDPFAE